MTALSQIATLLADHLYLTIESLGDISVRGGGGSRGRRTVRLVLETEEVVEYRSRLVKVQLVDAPACVRLSVHS